MKNNVIRSINAGKPLGKASDFRQYDRACYGRYWPGEREEFDRVMMAQRDTFLQNEDIFSKAETLRLSTALRIGDGSTGAFHIMEGAGKKSTRSVAGLKLPIHAIGWTRCDAFSAQCLLEPSG